MDGSSQIAMADVKLFLSTLTARLAEVERGRDTVNRFLSQDFNVFDYIGSYETSLSQIIADLLDPRGGHGQGVVFLEELLRLIGQERLIGECAKARVQREVWLDLSSKIDRVVEIDGFASGIENKPWAIEQPKQLER